MSLKYQTAEIVFQEVPDEVTLAIGIANCPRVCKGCHSPNLRLDEGEPLTTETLQELINTSPGITCVCFMGGDSDLPTLSTLSKVVKNNCLKAAWYTGMMFTPKSDRPICTNFDFIKVGSYVEKLGPLTSKTTNQKFYTRGYLIKDGQTNPQHFYDTTYKFWKHESKN